MATAAQGAERAATAKPYSLALLWWMPDRHQDGADEIEGEHQRRMVGPRAAGTIPALCAVP